MLNFILDCLFSKKILAITVERFIHTSAYVSVFEV